MPKKQFEAAMDFSKEVSKDTVTTQPKTTYRHPWEVEGSPISMGDRPPNQEKIGVHWQNGTLENHLRVAANNFEGIARYEFLKAIRNVAVRVEQQLK